jgi:hypothetical protein
MFKPGSLLQQNTVKAVQNTRATIHIHIQQQQQHDVTCLIAAEAY